MSSTLFSSVAALQQGLDAAWLRDTVIRNNIANQDTANFNRSTVVFESLYQAALNQEDFTARKTRPQHRDFGTAAAEAADVRPAIVQDTTTTMRMDGNNVDIEHENIELARNVMYYNALIVQLNSQFSQLRIAIDSGR